MLAVLLGLAAGLCPAYEDLATADAQQARRRSFRGSVDEATDSHDTTIARAQNTRTARRIAGLRP